MEIKKLSGIYKITSPSGRVYIGQAKDCSDRIADYRQLGCKNQPKIYRSILKHGWEAHKFEVIEYCDRIDLNNKERYYQEHYDAIENGLNCVYQESDEKPKVYSQESKDKISKSNTGKKRTDEVKEKYRQNNLGKVYSKETCLKKSLIFKGRMFSEEWKTNISNSRKGITLEFKKIKCTETNIIYNSLRQIEKEFNISRKTLSRMLKGHTINTTSFVYA